MLCAQGGGGLSLEAVPRDKDPFWDPLEPLLLGSAHLWLQSLAFRIPLEEQLEVRWGQQAAQGVSKAPRTPGVLQGVPKAPRTPGVLQGVSKAPRTPGVRH